MPVLDLEKIEYKPPQEGEDYIIVLTEMGEAQTEDGKQKKVQVALEPVDRAKGDNNIYNEGLWIGEGTYTPTSKLGSFLDAFEAFFKETELEHPKVKKPNYKNPEHWTGAIIRVLSWQNRNRRISVRGYADSELVKELQTELEAKRKD